MKEFNILHYNKETLLKKTLKGNILCVGYDEVITRKLKEKKKINQVLSIVEDYPTYQKALRQVDRKFRPVLGDVSNITAEFGEKIFNVIIVLSTLKSFQDPNILKNTIFSLQQGGKIIFLHSPRDGPSSNSNNSFFLGESTPASLTTSA